MIKTILWDFDGVILDSMKIKGDGFVKLFSSYGVENTKLLESYHYSNGGISRFKKIRYFYNCILKVEVSEEKVLELSNEFANIISPRLFEKNALILETVEFIKKNYKKYNFHIVSGAEHEELNLLCKNFELDRYFLSIDGSPTEKKLLVKNILEKRAYLKSETILIGDSINDYNAAMDNEITFFGYNNIELIDQNYIHSFSEFLNG